MPSNVACGLWVLYTLHAPEASYHGRAVANAVVGVDGVKMTSVKHWESLPQGRRSKRRLEFGGSWPVVTEMHSLIATKAG